MFTFCFTTIAARQMRNVSARGTSSRSVRRSVAAVAAVTVLFAAATANAGGGPKGVSLSNAGGSFGNRSGGAQITNSQPNANKFVLNSTTALNTDSFKIGKQPTDVSRALGNNVTTSTLLNKKITDKTKVDTTTRVGLSQGIKDKLVGNNKGIDKALSQDKQFCKDKNDCHKDCHNPCKYHCCPWWFCWDYPTWCPLYGSHCCGYWDDVPVVRIPVGLDLQLLAVRLVDSGDPEAQLGPTFRVWFRNNSSVAINHAFNIIALVAPDASPTNNLPQAGVRIPSIEAGQVLAADIRLPIAANQAGLPMLHVLVDSHREIGEVDEKNNGAVMPRAEILPLETQPEKISMATQPMGPMQMTAPLTGIETEAN